MAQLGRIEVFDLPSEDQLCLVPRLSDGSHCAPIWSHVEDRTGLGYRFELPVCFTSEKVNNPTITAPIVVWSDALILSVSLESVNSSGVKLLASSTMLDWNITSLSVDSRNMASCTDIAFFSRGGRDIWMASGMASFGSPPKSHINRLSDDRSAVPVITKLGQDMCAEHEQICDMSMDEESGLLLIFIVGRQCSGRLRGQTSSNRRYIKILRVI
jgi:hypothetical protein